MGGDKRGRGRGTCPPTQEQGGEMKNMLNEPKKHGTSARAGPGAVPVGVSPIAQGPVGRFEL